MILIMNDGTDPKRQEDKNSILEEEEILEEMEDIINTSTCITILHQDVCVEAVVTIKPNVKIGKTPKVICGDTKIEKIKHKDRNQKPHHHHKEHKSPKSDHHEEESCSFLVSQKLCIEIPLEFTAEAKVKPKKVACNDGEAGPCPIDPPQSN
ncbi:hypothetical protein FGG79_02625 [Bacillus sp. BHET2]|uniref:hypothetical protein n=1 Tax=Bacillus sp. BHET2 TaxID=2583818 RepID=UPI001486B6E2|nr:hypothetical protein [Bacillus sp. BHET2]TMU87051.1 hypothetical protein FGG79_02625 [Bacillus sp. BHET2]